MDVAYLESMFELFKKVSAREKIIGWYHTGPKLKACDLQIHHLFRKYVLTMTFYVKFLCLDILGIQF